jgi:SAM-dependent methyltransferase
LSYRDTDSDWRKIGAEQPFWGVLSGERYRRENLTDASLLEFYRTGHDDIGQVVDRAARFLGDWPAPRRALDFGCGVGRLAFAMTRHAGEVVGYDVSPEMLGEARAQAQVQAQASGDAAPSFTDRWPEPGDGPGFDWINSYIVFQHIPPDRGLRLLGDLLALLAPEGLVSLHFTFHRAPHLPPPPPPPAPLRRLARRLLGRPTEPPPGSVAMYDYDLGAVFEALTSAGIEETAVFHTDHDGHHGAQIVGRRA